MSDAKKVPSDGADDPYLWLEEIEGARAVAFVDAANARCAQALHDARWRADADAALAILNADDKLPYVGRSGDWLYNLWRDAAHPRGLWRRTTLESYRTPAPDWETLLDIDALGAAEGVAWAFGGAARAPNGTRALLSLSFDGSDAVEVREFDLAAKRFVDGGFVIPKAKTQVGWIDDDTLLFGSAFDDGDTTEAGYGRVVRRWRRGSPLAAAEAVFEVERSDVAAWFDINRRPGFQRVMFWRAKDFTRMEIFLDAPGRERVRLDVPEEVSLSAAAGRLLVSPKHDWRVGGRTFASGSLGAIGLDDFLGGARDFVTLFAPTRERALENWTETRHGVVLQLLDSVRSRLMLARPDGEGRWRTDDIAGLPDHASISADAFGGEDDPELANDVLLTVTGFARPTTLALWRGDGAPEPLKAQPPVFDAEGVAVKQCFATAADGERIPYFLIGKALDDATPRPTLLYGYGGFEVSLTPSYMGVAGKLWLERGGLYALANIRGGGEFGPRWHEAARRATKHVAHDDFAAVARDLGESGVTTPAQLACHGGSNGGLLVGVMLTRYPELFGAIWCSVPLLDMARYTKLLAGQSWIAEYGDPDDATEWPFIAKFSPYHLLEAGRRYPPIFITTNRTDDRVHPGHARKMAAKLEALGAEVLFHETVAGGHSGAVDAIKQAEAQARGFAFLRRTIGEAGSDRSRVSESGRSELRS